MNLVTRVQPEYNIQIQHIMPFLTTPLYFSKLNISVLRREITAALKTTASRKQTNSQCGVTKTIPERSESQLTLIPQLQPPGSNSGPHQTPVVNQNNASTCPYPPIIVQNPWIRAAKAFIRFLSWHLNRRCLPKGVNGFLPS